ncbi:MAG: amidohydrolase family protein, partial [Planctomycetia bacterium]|nr:amidohydrolase family protein [Planctomycetia bacterium]
MLRRLALLAGLTLSLSLPHLAHAQAPVDADVLLVGGTILDGSGGPGTAGGVAIRGDRIVAVGTFQPGKIGRTIDCRGLVVAPGFIDLHNHSDQPILGEKTRVAVNYLSQGCTTMVTGNCGSGHVKVGEFYAKLEKNGTGTNIVHLLPQGSIRNAVLGEVNRAPSDEELDKMRKLVDDGMKEGAWGITSGLIYVPSAYANVDELSELAKVVAGHGGIYASHIRNESEGLLDAIEEALEIGRRSGTSVHISHFKASGPTNWGAVRAAAHRIEQARRQGQTVTADQYPYIASSTSLAATVLSSGDREGGNEGLLKRLNDPEQAEKLRAQIARSLARKGKLQIAAYKPKPAWVGKVLTDIAETEQKEPADIAVEILQNGGAAIVNFGMSEEDVRFVMTLPWVATASDGRAFLPNADRPHPRSYGTFPRKIGLYAIQEKVVSPAHAIRSSSGLPAEI